MELRANGSPHSIATFIPQTNELWLFSGKEPDFPDAGAKMLEGAADPASFFVSKADFLCVVIVFSLP
jgi:hypothetical protein